ncbi:TIGR01777 family oxidoreductase [Streptomyces seoulensis]
MKIVLPGGSGQVGTVLERALSAAGHEVVVLTRRPARPGQVRWDGRTAGPWTAEIDGCDAVVNLAGRSVNCRYTPANLRQMMDSRVDSARAVGEAIAAAARPPRVWLQMSTATIYAHRFDAANDERDGLIGGSEPGVPDHWSFSVDIARAWEREQERARTPHTRKVALRSAMVMSPDRGGVLDVLLGLTRLGLGGPVAGGAQYVSWIHDRDFVRAVRFLIGREDLAGPVNLAAPAPLPQRALMRVLRAAWGAPVGLPATGWMAGIGAFALRSDTELLLKSRRVVPGRLLDAGFAFDHPHWPEAAEDLVRRVRVRPRPERRGRRGTAGAAGAPEGRAAG